MWHKGSGVCGSVKHWGDRCGLLMFGARLDDTIYFMLSRNNVPGTYLRRRNCWSVKVDSIAVFEPSLSYSPSLNHRMFKNPSVRLDDAPCFLCSCLFLLVVTTQLAISYIHNRPSCSPLARALKAGRYCCHLEGAGMPNLICLPPLSPFSIRFHLPPTLTEKAAYQCSYLLFSGVTAKVGLTNLSLL